MPVLDVRRLADPSLALSLLPSPARRHGGAAVPMHRSPSETPAAFQPCGPAHDDDT